MKQITKTKDRTDDVQETMKAQETDTPKTSERDTTETSAITWQEMDTRALATPSVTSSEPWFWAFWVVCTALLAISSLFADSWAHWEAKGSLPRYSEVFLLHGIWGLWSIGVGWIFLQRWVEMAKTPSLGQLLGSSGVLVRWHWRSEKLPEQAALFGVFGKVLPPPIQREEGWFYTEQGRLARIGEMWMLGGILVIVSVAFLQPFLGRSFTSVRGWLFAAPWILMGGVMSLLVKPRIWALWREGFHLLCKIVTPHDPASVKGDLQKLDMMLQSRFDGCFSFASKEELSWMEEENSSERGKKGALWFFLPMLAVFLGVLIWLGGQGGLSSLAAFRAYLMPTISFFWVILGFVCLLAFSWAAWREDSFLLGLGGFWCGAVALFLGWLTASPQQQAVALPSVVSSVGVLLSCLGMGLLWVGAMLATRASLLSQEAEEAATDAPRFLFFLALLAFGAASLLALQWGQRTDLLARLNVPLACFALTSFVWRPFFMQPKEPHAAPSVQISLFYGLWHLLVAASVGFFGLVWMFLLAVTASL